MRRINRSEFISNKDGLILIVALWILIIVSLLSIGLAHQVLVYIKSTRYQKDNVKLFFIATAAIEQARAVLENDSNQVDTLNELWSCGIDFPTTQESIFKDQRLTEGTFTASYVFDTKDETRIFYGLVDEERKININTASSEKLTALFSMLFPEVSNPKSLADAVLYWRGENPQGYEPTYYKEQGYLPPRAKFKTIEELNLVDGFRQAPDLLARCRDFITVFTPDDKININTASALVLKAVFHSLDAEEGLEEKLADYIIDLRNGEDNQEGTEDDEPIYSNQLKQDLLNISDLTDEQRQWINNQDFPFTDKSNHFTINVTAHLDYSPIYKHIIAVIKRTTDKKTQLIFWHEE